MSKYEVVPLEKQDPEIQAIRSKTPATVSDERFQGGIIFANLIIDGIKPNPAYAEAFNVTKEESNKVSSQFHRSKWVQKLILYLTPDEGTLNQADCKTVIRKLMAIINSERTSPREKTEAAKALQPYIKQEKANIENQFNLDMDVVNIGESASAKLKDQISTLVSAGKMVNDKGEVIDVELIH